MNTVILRILSTLFIVLAMDLYAYQAFKTAFKFRALPWVYWGTSLALVVWTLYVAFTINRSDPAVTKQYMYVFGAMILFLVPKMLVGGILLVEDTVRFFGWLANGAQRLASSTPPDDAWFQTGRRAAVSRIALGVAVIPFVSILYGMARGRYRFRVVAHELEFPDLPQAFDGYRIIQISDIHSGSFDNRAMVEYGVDLINQQGADLVLFTGDMVNNVADELVEWKDVFSQINAPDGVFSVLGNHDYGDYLGWPSAEAKQANLERLVQHQTDMGFQLLRNEHRVLQRGSDRLVIAGVENWGFPPFPKYGDLNRTLQGLSPNDFTVLMSHDPSHFEGEVKTHPHRIALTLSGHTHGMQFGIEIPGFRWSPVKYRYPRWAGIYREANRILHVNRGFGYLAFPGRVGIWPEITAITLRRREGNEIK